jgi:sugar/nucleoside kinase (ribokinase family)
VTRIVVLGDLNVDIVAVQETSLAHGSDTPARVSLHAGGGGANVAAWLAKLGVDVTLIGRVGTDPLAPVALSGLDGVDLQVVRDPQRTTGTCIVLVSPGGERTMLPDPGANDALAVGDLPPLEGDVLHVSGYALMRPGSRGAALAAIDRAREAGMKISVDPASAAPLANDPVFLQRIAPIDLLLPNADEAAVLGPQIDVPEVVVKSGAKGARWWTDWQITVWLTCCPGWRTGNWPGASSAGSAGCSRPPRNSEPCRRPGIRGGGTACLGMSGRIRLRGD